MRGEPHGPAGPDPRDPTVAEERLAELCSGHPGEVLAPFGPVEASAGERSSAGPQAFWAQPDGVGQPGEAGRGEGESADIVAVVAAVDVPVNVLYLPGQHTITTLTDLGVRRISTGSLLFRAAWPRPYTPR